MQTKPYMFAATLAMLGMASALIAADAYEPDNSYGAARQLVGGITQTHSLDPIGDDDWCWFTLASPTSVTLATSGISGDTLLYLYSSDGTTLIRYDDDSGVGAFSLITNVYLNAGLYYVCVSEFGDDGIIDPYYLNLYAPTYAATSLVVSACMVTNDANGDGLLSPGEWTWLNIGVRNAGIVSFSNITAVLSSLTPGVEVTSGSSGYAGLAPGSNTMNLTPFHVTVSPFLPGGSVRFRHVAVAANMPGVAFTNDCSLSLVGLVAHYPLDGNANDISGNANHGAVSNATFTTDRLGRTTSACHFDGSLDFVEIPDHPVLRFGTNDFTIAMWLRYPPQSNSYGYSQLLIKSPMLSYPYAGIAAWVDYSYRSGTILFRVDSREELTSMATGLNTNAWWHCVLVKRGMREEIYINGVLDSWRTITYSSVDNSSPLLLGVYSANRSIMNFCGDIDDLRIYNRSFTSNDLYQMYLGSTPGIDITSSPATVSYAVTTYSVAGTNGDDIVGTMTVTNAANGDVHGFDAAATWQAPPVNLAVGLNTISVMGVSSTGGIVWDAVQITRQPQAPTGVSATDGLYMDRVTIQWTALAGADCYAVYRSTNADSSLAVCITPGNVATAACNDVSAYPGRSYTYWVKVRQNGAWSPFGTGDSGHMQLSPPSLFSFTASKGTYTNRIAVAWPASTGATRYRLFRALDPRTNGAVAVATLDGVRTYSDTNVVPGQIYTYWVQAGTDVAWSGLSGGVAGYPLLTVWLFKTDWKYVDKISDLLAGRKLPLHLAPYFAQGWRLGMVDADYGAVVDTPHVMTGDKKFQKFSYVGMSAVIKYSEKYNKRSRGYTATLVYLLNGDMPRTQGIYYQAPPSWVP